MVKDLPKLDFTREQKQNLKTLLYRLNWVDILSNAVKSRPTSWKEHPIVEYRNASDEVCSALIRALEDAKVLLSFKEEVK